MANWNDGGLPHGTRKIKVYPPGSADSNGATTYSGTTKGIYVLESWGPARPGYKQNRYDEVRNPSGAFGVDDFPEGSGVAQLANVNSILLDVGDAFTTLRASDATGGSGTAETWIITSIDEPEEQGAIKKISFRAQKAFALGTPPAIYP